MNNHTHQKKVAEIEWRRESISELLTDEEFVLLYKGNGYKNWDDNYYCIIEQQIMQEVEQ